MKKYIIFICFIIASCQSNENLEKGKEVNLNNFNLSYGNTSFKIDTSGISLPIVTIAKWVDNVQKIDRFFRYTKLKNISAKDLMYWVINDDSLRPKEFNEFYIRQLNENRGMNENYWEDKFLLFYATKIFDRSAKYFAVSKEYNIYLLAGFGTSNISKLISNEIGDISNDTIAYKVARFLSCYASNEMFPKLIVDNQNFDSLKKIYDNIMLPKMMKYNDKYEFEIFSIAYNHLHAIMRNRIVLKNKFLISHKIDTVNLYRNN